MLSYPLIILIGLIGGAAVGVQVPIAGSMGQRLGGMGSSLIVHLGGALFSLVFLVLRRGENISGWSRLPWYMLISGIFGVILYQCVSLVLPRLGGTLMVTLIIIGQLLVNIVLDHFGWLGVPVHPISLSRVLGVLILMVGGYLIAR